MSKLYVKVLTKSSNYIQYFYQPGTDSAASWYSSYFAIVVSVCCPSVYSAVHGQSHVLAKVTKLINIKMVEYTRHDQS